MHSIHSKYLLSLALISAWGYALAAIFAKQALVRGCGSWQLNFYSNLALAAACIPFWFFIKPDLLFIGNYHLALWAGLSYTLGQVFVFLALLRGDVSVATPLLGTKTLSVALISTLFFGQMLDPQWWWAAILTSVGIFFITCSRQNGSPQHHNLLLTVVFALLAAFFFALEDVLLLHASEQMGGVEAITVMLSEVGLLTLLSYPLIFKKKIWVVPSGLNWFFPAVTLLTLQGLGISACVVLSKDATASNILYSSRCVWSVLLAWAISRYLGSGESKLTVPAMLLRTLGAIMLFVAILIVLT